eukprot:TRINITY_DN68101_c6_g1_i1.p1 TRINITY_DN68101_c6_g1~~TRINITY_DN68101_c6_g1_i1.p1  ORF type:complete len:548 (+),score=24.24 TRINITY_DN68101_c6_g1_i1:39-1682(+)
MSKRGSDGPAQLPALTQSCALLQIPLNVIQLILELAETDEFARTCRFAWRHLHNPRSRRRWTPVYVRVRPWYPNEQSAVHPAMVEACDESSSHVQLKVATLAEQQVVQKYREQHENFGDIQLPVETSEEREQFAFCKVFSEKNKDPNQPNAEVYNTIGPQMLDRLLEGYSCSLVVRGGPRSGKSFTLFGNRPVWTYQKQEGDIHPGFIQLFIDDLFARIEQRKQNPAYQRVNWGCSVSISGCTMCGERLYDLLLPRGHHQRKQEPALKVRDHPVLGIHISQLSSRRCPSAEDAKEMVRTMHEGEAMEAFHFNSYTTHYNCFIMLDIHQAKTVNGRDYFHTSQVKFVELLGGSARTTSSLYANQGRISRSTTTFSRVVDALAQLSTGARRVIPPYRESMVTRILQNDLGGSNCTWVVGCVSPAVIHYDNTIADLRLLSRLQSVASRVRVGRLDQEKWKADEEDPRTADHPKAPLPTSYDVASSMAALQGQLEKLRQSVAGPGLGQHHVDTPEEQDGKWQALQAVWEGTGATIQQFLSRFPKEQEAGEG